MDCSLPDSSIHGIFQARILEWAAISFSRRSSRPRDWTQVSRIVGRRFTVWATRESSMLLLRVVQFQPNIPTHNSKIWYQAVDSISSSELVRSQTWSQYLLLLKLRRTLWGSWAWEPFSPSISSRQDSSLHDLPWVPKVRDITLPTKVYLVKTMVFPVVMYGCESWTIKKAEHQRINALKLWCWEKTLESPLDTRRCNKSILKEINPEYSLEGLMLKLKLQYFGHLMEETTHYKRPWGWERLKTGGEGDDRGWDGWMASPTQWTWVWAGSGRWWRAGFPGVLQCMGLQSQKGLNNNKTREEQPRDHPRQD